LAELPPGFSDHFQQQYSPKRDELIAEVKEHGGSADALAKLPEFKNQFASFRHPNHPQHQEDQNTIPALNKVIDRLIKEIEATPLLRVVDIVHECLPTFIYMDDHRTFVGSAQLDDVLKHKKEKRLSAEEETIIVIMEMSGLDLEEEVQKGGAENREQRILDMNDASNTFTSLIAARWS